MKKSGILHPELSRLVAGLGHTDYLVLADKGFPLPKCVERIDLGLSDDIPTVPDVLQVLADEMKIDRMIITHEMEDISPDRLRQLKERYPGIPFEAVSHREFKELTLSAYGAVKTGDCCPYANVIVVSG